MIQMHAILQLMSSELQMGLSPKLVPNLQGLVLQMSGLLAQLDPTKNGAPIATNSQMNPYALPNVTWRGSRINPSNLSSGVKSLQSSEYDSNGSKVASSYRSTSGTDSFTGSNSEPGNSSEESEENEPLMKTRISRLPADTKMPSSSASTSEDEGSQSDTSGSSSGSSSDESIEMPLGKIMIQKPYTTGGIPQDVGTPQGNYQRILMGQSNYYTNSQPLQNDIRSQSQYPIVPLQVQLSTPKGNRSKPSSSHDRDSLLNAKRDRVSPGSSEGSVSDSSSTET